MRRLMMLGLIIFIGQAFAVNLAHPTEPQNNPWYNDINNLIPDDATVNVQIVPGNNNSYDAAAAAPPSGPFYTGKDIGYNPGPSPLFGTDVLVMAHGVPTLGVVTTDQDESNGDIYVSLLVPHTGDVDTVYTYRSIDGGYTWTMFTRQVGAASTGGIKDHRVLIGSDASGTWFYSFCLYDAAGSSGGLWVLRARNDLSSPQWTQIIPSGDTLYNITVDRNVENPQHIFLGIQTDPTDVRLGSSSDNSLTWGNWRYVSSNGSYPTVAAGADGYVYIAYQQGDTAEIRIGRYTNNLISPTFVFNTIEAGGEGDWTPSIAAARTTPGTSQVAWIIYRHRHSNGNADIHYSTSANGGATWAAGTVWPPTNTSHNTWDMKYPYIRVSYNSGLLRAVTTVPEAPTDSVVYAFSRNTSPTTWEDRGVHNDYRITGEFGPTVDYSSDCAGGYIVYREFASANTWFDAYDFTGIEEQTGTKKSNLVLLAPNPSTNKTRLSFTMNQPGLVRISIYDASGQLVRSVMNENKAAGLYSVELNNQQIAAGIYFVKLDLGADQVTKTLTIVR